MLAFPGKLRQTVSRVLVSVTEAPIASHPTRLILFNTCALTYDVPLAEHGPVYILDGENTMTQPMHVKIPTTRPHTTPATIQLTSAALQQARAEVAPKRRRSLDAAQPRAPTQLQSLLHRPRGSCRTSTLHFKSVAAQLHHPWHPVARSCPTVSFSKTPSPRHYTPLSAALSSSLDTPPLPQVGRQHPGPNVGALRVYRAPSRLLVRCRTRRHVGAAN